MAELTDKQVAEALGWTDIKPWGGRGVRGLRPGVDCYRHEALPHFTGNVTDILRGIDRLRDPALRLGRGAAPVVTLRVDSHMSGRWCTAMIGGLFRGESENPAEALCRAVMLYLRKCPEVRRG